MTRSRRPKKIWDHCLDLEGIIFSHTALDIFKLEGEVTETIMTVYTTKISIIVDHEWYDWIVIYDPV